MNGRYFRLMVLLIGCGTPAWSAEVVRITSDNWSDVVPQGKEADWIYGDYVLRNDRIVAVVGNPIAGRHANMTVRDVGGALIDLTFRQQPSDQLSCFYPGGAAFPLRTAQMMAEVGAAVLTCSGAYREGLPTLQVEYRLRDGETHLQVDSHFFNPHAGPIEFDLQDAVRADKGFSYQLDERLGLFVAEDVWWKQAYGVLAVDHELASVADTLDRGRPVFRYSAGRAAQVKLEPGDRYTLSRYVLLGAHSLDVRAQAQRLQGETIQTAQLAVMDAKGPISDAEVAVHQGEDMLGKLLTHDDGTAHVALRPGRYELKVTANGRGTSTAALDLSSATQSTKIQLPLPGYVQGKVKDQDGQPIPAKIQLRGKDVEDPFFGPDTKAFAVHNLKYSADGNFQAEVLPGTYEVIISRGTEFDADFRTVRVQQGETTNIEATLTRSVDTSGWVSSDFHSHSSPSGDNTSSQLGRVLNLLAEHIEFAPCTEHNRVSSYVPHLRSLQVEHLLATCSGMELTGNPLPVNHQNAFPLEHHPHVQDGGGPTTDENPIVQIRRLARWDNGSDKLLQENHPNLEQIWADRDLDGQPDEGFAQMFGYMDVVEVHPPQDIFATGGEKTGQYRNVIFSWLRMLNRGYRIPGVVNTDAHYNFHGSGWLRNYIKSSTDVVAEIDVMEMVHEAEHGHVIMTNGPFLEVSARSGSGTALPGDDLRLQEGHLELRVRVQCPNWFDVNRVQVFLNGRPLPAMNYHRRTHAAMFDPGTVKFDERLKLTLTEDAHLIVATIGENLKLGPVMGPERGADAPCALSNPIFLDVDGGGFQSNGDLLDFPLPMKTE